MEPAGVDAANADHSSANDSTLGGKRSTRRWPLRLFSLALVVAGVANYVNDLEPPEPNIPLQQLVVAPRLEELRALSIEQGVLAGHGLVLIALDFLGVDPQRCRTRDRGFSLERRRRPHSSLLAVRPVRIRFPFGGHRKLRR
jgi:hypothetical protein